MIVQNFGRLGAFGGEWEDWCDREYPADAKNSEGKLVRELCKKAGIFAPWTIIGKAERGLPVTWTNVKNAASEVAATAQQVFTPDTSATVEVSTPATAGAGPGPVLVSKPFRPAPYTANPAVYAPPPSTFASSGLSTGVILGGVAAAAALFYLLKK